MSFILHIYCQIIPFSALWENHSPTIFYHIKNPCNSYKSICLLMLGMLIGDIVQDKLFSKLIVVRYIHVVR
jgi:hypothetical protein